MTLIAVDSPLAADGRDDADRLLERLVRGRRARLRRRARRRRARPRTRSSSARCMKKERAHWVPRVRELAAEHPTWSEVELTWALIEEMGVRGAAILAPVFDARGRPQGPPVAPDEPRELPRRRSGCSSRRSTSRRLAPNIQVKFPTTAAGLEAIEEATARGVVDQRHGRVHGRPGDRRRRGRRARPAALRGGRRRREPVQPGLHAHGRAARRLGEGPRRARRHRPRPRRRELGRASPCSSGRTRIYQERGYRTRLLAAAYRHRLHWTELVGGDVVLTMPHAWQVRFNDSGIEPGAADRRPRRPGDRRRPAARGPGLPARLRARRPRDRRVRRRTARPPGPCAASSPATTTSRA